MTVEQVRQTIATYRSGLQQRGITPSRHPDVVLCLRDTDAPLAHIAWMLDRMDEFLDEGRIEKTMRWLGFVQGALWMWRDYTIGDLKRHNMP